jgi:hypothetical protein
MWERGERKQVLNGRRGKMVQNVLYEERQRETIEHTWNGCSEMRERGRERNGEKYRKRQGWGIGIKMLFFEIVSFMFIQRDQQ